MAADEPEKAVPVQHQIRQLLFWLLALNLLITAVAWLFLHQGPPVTSHEGSLEWWHHLVDMALFLAIFYLMTMLAAWQIYRQWQQRDRMIASLASQEAKYKTIADHTYAWEFWISPEGKILYSSPSCKRITGYDSEAFIADPTLFRSIIHPDDLELFTDHRQQTIAEIGSHNLTLRIRHADGTCRWLEHECQPVYNDSGTFLGNRGSNRDVTGKKQMEAALKESEEHFHQLFVQNWDAIMLLNQDSLVVVDANPAFLELFQYSLDQLRGQVPWPLVEPETLDTFRQLLQQTSVEGEGFLEKGLCRRSDNRSFTVSAKTKLIRMKEQNLLYCSIRDISDRIRLEEEKAQAQAKLIHANKMTSLGMLVSGIAHEINNPNQYISLNGSLLTDVWRDCAEVISRYREEHGEVILKGMPFDMAAKTVPKLLRGVTDGSARIKAIVNNLKDLSRDNSRLLKTSFDINNTVEAAIQILAHHIQKHTYQFTTDLKCGLPQLKGNPQQIEQVIMNLIINSLQSLPDKDKSVCVSTFLDTTDMVAIAVRDQGRGMTSEVLERVTEPFFSTNLDKGGTGLGLFISATLVKEHGGSLEFDSAPGAGTTAILKLPVAEKFQVQEAVSG